MKFLYYWYMSCFGILLLPHLFTVTLLIIMPVNIKIKILLVNNKIKI